MTNDTADTAGWVATGRVAGATEPMLPEDEIDAPQTRESDSLKKLLGLAIAAVTIAALYFGQGLLIPIMLAVILSFILSPMVNLLQRARLWRVPAVLLTVVAALGGIGALGTMIGTEAAALSVNAPQYAAALQTKVKAGQDLALARVAAITKAVTERRPARAPAANTPREPAATTSEPRPPKPVLVEIAPPATTPLSVAKAILAPIIVPLEKTLIVLMVAVFILLQREDLRDRFIRVFGSTDLHRTTLAIDDAVQRLRRYFLSQLAVNVSFGIAVAIGLWLFGIPSPALWGVLAGLLRFVPYIGPVLAAVPPVALGAALDPGWGLAIWIAVFFTLVESAIGYVIEPLLYGHSTGLSPFSVIVAAIFWTYLWGPVGLIMSTPMTLCLIVLGRHVKALEFFDVLLGDRPALTPVESFYQRILANNADEALAQAEVYLGKHELREYYDQVVVEGLKLAANDQARGMIDGPRRIEMLAAMRAVITDLEDHVDPDTEQETVGGVGDQRTVACIVGRGRFDGAVAAMLAQLLRRRGLQARTIAHKAVGRDSIDALDLTGVTTIALCYLDLSGSSTHLRFLVKRLRAKAPSASIMIGLWPGEGAANEPPLAGTLGADDVFVSLTQAERHIADDNGQPREQHAVG